MSIGERRLLGCWRDITQFGKAISEQQRPLVDGVAGIRPGLKGVDVAVDPGRGSTVFALIEIGGVLVNVSRAGFRVDQHVFDVTRSSI